MAERLGPRDHSEAVALFRAQVVGELAAQQLKRGQLRAELRRLSGIRFRPPGASCTRYYGASTLERWYYRLRSGGVEALRPTGRSDRGHARALNDEQRELLVAIKRENPRASADLILRTLELDGRLPKGAVSAPTVRRLFGENGLDRASIRVEAGGRARMRWEAAAPGVLWHSDVCHGPALRAGGRSVPLRIHAILDDASRYVVAIQACDNERESEMLSLTAKALQAHGRPQNPCTWTTARPTAARCWPRPAAAWASTCATRVPTIRRRGGRWNDSGERCAPDVWTTSARSAR